MSIPPFRCLRRRSRGVLDLGLRTRPEPARIRRTSRPFWAQPAQRAQKSPALPGFAFRKGPLIPDFAVAAFPALLGRHPCCGDRHRSGPMERRRHHDAGGRSPKLARRGRFLAARARQCRGDRAMRRGRAHGRFRSAMHHHRESAGSTGAVGLWGDTSYFGRFSSASTGPAAIATRRAAIRLRSCSGSGRDDSAS